MIGLMVVVLMVFFTCFGEMSYFKEKLWNLGTKLCSIAPGKCNVGSVAFQEFNVRHMLQDNHEGRDCFPAGQLVY